MYEYSDGNPADGVKGSEKVTSWFYVEPVDYIPFADHDESLQNTKSMNQIMKIE